MQKVKFLSKKEIDDIVKIYVESNLNEEGTISLFKDENTFKRYLKVLIKASIKNNMLYSLSENKEGFVILNSTLNPLRSSAKIYMFLNFIRTFGFKGYYNFLKSMKSDKSSLLDKLRMGNKDFIKVEMLLVETDFQNKGYMHKIMNEIFKFADEYSLPVILSTDSELKKDKYVHIGMKYLYKRKLKGGIYLYELIKE
ncbi:hypothetical protein [Anaerofustis sp. NSJ-163]|uniref:hypothetical protein n=1 Tax=Anaerofustis sp. NSJ-163 TaxID=2944391 RepID=UPI00209C66E7|nr:hypothetical protein [Anaerofustis sp. NSJ-163]MCO8193915.1 hypothetical protein [Anaerofustis sp. NSJ-163]